MTHQVTGRMAAELAATGMEGFTRPVLAKDSTTT